MPLPVTPILVAGATAAIGYFFQENSAKNARLRQKADAELEARRQLRDSELRRAQEIFDEISHAMDAEYYYLVRGAMHVAVRKAKGDTTREMEDAKTWDGFEKAVLKWTTNTTRFSAQVRRYFGDENRTRLRNIQDVFEKAESFITATYYNKKESVVIERDGKKYEDSGEFYGMVRPLENDILIFTEQLIEEIQKQSVGQLRNIK